MRASRCASPMRSRPSPSRVRPHTSSSAPTRSSARWRASASATKRAKPPSSPPCARGDPRPRRSQPRSPTPIPQGQSSTGEPSSRAQAPSASRCPPREEGGVAIGFWVGPPGGEGGRETATHSRRDGEEGEWTQSASGALSATPVPAPEPLGAWPPEGAEPLEVDYLYDLLAEAGLEYGPAFQGLTAAWSDGEQIYAEVSLPEEQAQEAERFGIHPALLDSALHGIALAATEGSQGMRLPFSWSGVSLRAVGARELRVKIAPRTGGAVSLTVADGAGAPLVTVDSLALRPLDPSQLQAPSHGTKGLLGLEWAEIPLDQR